MAKKQADPMDRFNGLAGLAADVEARQKEQAATLAAAAGSAKSVAPVSEEAPPEPAKPRYKRRPKRGPNTTSLTVMMSQEDKDFIRAYSEEHMIGMSDMVHSWLMQLRKQEAAQKMQ